MAFIIPYVTDESITYKGDIIKTLLSVVIRLTDDFTGKEATGNITVILKETSKKAIKNLSDYYIFTDLVNDNLTIDVLSDLYFSEENIDTSKVKLSDVILELDTNLSYRATTAILKDISKLQKGDIIEFRNAYGDIEQRNITSVDVKTKTISWAEELNYKFNDSSCKILALKNPFVSVLLKPLPSYPFPNNATLVRGLIIDSREKPVINARVKIESQNIETKSDKNGEFIIYFNENINEEILIEIENNGISKSINANLEEGETKSLGKIEFP